MLKKTALYNDHLALGAKLVDFHGWELPIHYGSQLAEHEKVRQDAGIFDVSHMAPVDIYGQDAKAFLDVLNVFDLTGHSKGSGALQ